MRSILPLTAITLSLALSGCASSNNPNPDTAQTTKGNIVCERERETGTRLSRTTCRTLEQIEAEREDARNTVRRNTISPGLGGN